MSYWGCHDELATCANLPGLFEADGTTCRWPSAELCLRTCGQCDLVAAARSCTSLPRECTGDFCRGDERVDWQSYFQNITTTSSSSAPSFCAKCATDGAWLVGEEHLRNARIISERPWVAEFPHFLSEEEANEVVRISLRQGFRDEDEHPKHIRDVHVTNCDAIGCMREPFINELSRRTSSLLGLPSNNFESIEFVRYESGQHYVWHSDEYSWRTNDPDPVAVLSGPRVLTMFFYLSDVESGGGTAFAGPDSTGRTKRLMVTPRKGKAILWANTLEDWRRADPAAMHSAMPVDRGVKLAATLWVHSSGFRIPELYAGRSCHSRFGH